LLIAEILVYFPLPLAPVPDDEPDEPEDVSLPQPIVPIPMPMIRKKANINPVIFRFMFSPPFSFYSPKSKKAITAAFW
jgi:hypothetical protein